MTDVFISYSRKDKAFVQRLHEAIVAENRETWVDWEGIPLTADWWAEIQEGIEAADTFVFILSPDSVSSKVCNAEVEYAAKLKKRIVPIVYRDTKDVPEKLARLNWVFGRESDNFSSFFRSLMKTIDVDLEWVKSHTRLTQRSIEWNKKANSDSYLLRGEDLTEAEQMLTQTEKEPKLTELQANFIVTSRKNATQRQRRTLVVITIVLIVVVALGLYATYQWQTAERALQSGSSSQYESYVAEQERDQALSRELAANSKLNLQTDPQLSLLLAIQAISESETTEAVDALKQVMKISEDIEVEELLARAQEQLTRSWSLDECKKYLHQETCPASP